MKYQTKERKPSQRPDSVPSSVGLVWAPVISGVSCKHQASPISAQACLFWQLKSANFKMDGYVASRFHVALILLPSQPIILVPKPRPACELEEQRTPFGLHKKRSYMYKL